MTTITEREIPARTNGSAPRLDSPAVRASARASVSITERVGKISGMGRSITAAARTWWGFTARPATIAELWQASAVDRKRIPGKADTLHALWQVSNWTDRLIMFAAIAAAPTSVTGPLRWLAARPTRRWAFYLVTAALAVTYQLGRS